jgi:hypothetical protein
VRADQDFCVGAAEGLAKTVQIFRRRSLQGFQLHVDQRRAGIGVLFQERELLLYGAVETASTLPATAGRQYEHFPMLSAKGLQTSHPRLRVRQSVQTHLDK